MKIALVTGAARGIGAACAERLGRDGHHVVVADIDETAAKAKVAEMARAGLSASVLRVDVTDADDVERGVAASAAELGALHILVNNAGVAGPAVPVGEYDIQQWKRVLSVDLDGVFYCCRAAVPYMVRQGWGRVVNIASVAGKEGNPQMSAYSAAKAGVIGFTKAFAKEVAGAGVLVNSVTPAVVETEILQQVDQKTIDYMVSRIPMGRTCLPEEVAAMVSWLASDECSFTTGATFDISGGRTTY